MSFEGSLIILICCVLVPAYYWNLFFEDQDTQTSRCLVGWACKGVFVPVIVWMVFNSGISPRMPPLMPEIAIAQSGGASWASATLEVTADGLLVIGSYWAAITLGWLATLIATRASNRTDFISLSVFWCLVLTPLVWPILHFSGWKGVGFAGMVWLLPIVHCTMSLAPSKKPCPIYSRAIAKMKFGRYAEAESAVIRELEKCEEDFDGWMLLADLYANQFNDLPEADRTIREVCDQPKITSLQISIALHRLADWHLKLGENPVAARVALEAICQKLPGSHVARMARQRMDQLPATREELREQLKARSFPLPALSEILDEGADHTKPETNHADAALLANQYAEKLKRDPNSVPEREKLARILAERLGEVDLAIDQLELLIGMPEQPDQKITEWLSLLAAWQLNYRRDNAAARKPLERLVHEYPQTAQAFAAQRRLNLMEMELRVSRAVSVGGS